METNEVKGNAEVIVPVGTEDKETVVHCDSAPAQPLRGLRVLTVSHGITEQTGFAQQMRKVAMYLQAQGAKVYNAHPRYRGIPLSPPEVGGVEILPWGNDPNGSDCIHYYIDRYQPHYVITLADVWDKQFLAAKNTAGLRHHDWDWLGWFPFDTSNDLPFWNDNLKQMDCPVVMSEFGLDLMRKSGTPGVHIPHSFDPTIYKPLPAEKRDEARAQLRAAQEIPPDKFVVLCVAHNQVRKKMDRVVRAFAIFAKDKPDAVLWLHCTPNDNTGWDLSYIANTLGVGDKVFFSNKAQKLVGDNFVTNEDMARMYQSADVHLLLTGGEGFGLPLLESMACGVPNITTDFTTGPELVGASGGGILVPVDTTEYHQNGGEWALANIQAAADALNTYYNDRERMNVDGEKAWRFVHGKYTDAMVLPRWIELFRVLPDFKARRHGNEMGHKEFLKPVRMLMR
jgi:glycosyltransferase involved in cell wall biosynthesis